MSKINVLIAGSTGYIGVQLTKILANHKNVKIKYLCGSSSIGKEISYFDKSLSKKKLPLIYTNRMYQAFLASEDYIHLQANGSGIVIAKERVGGVRIPSSAPFV